MQTKTFFITPPKEVEMESPNSGLPPVRNTLAPAERRAMTRQYKQTRAPAGVFTLTNQASGRVYVGGSLNLEGAMNRMRFELNGKTHRNKRLQQDWIAQGSDQFCFAVVDRIKDREDSSFDYRSELKCMLELWRIEIPCHGDKGYSGAGA